MIHNEEKKVFYELIRKVVNKLIDKNLTISTCESATAGFLASSICDVSGASKIFSEAYIVYSNEAKIKILNIEKSLIDKYGVVSKECAISMALNLFSITKSNICISVTGNLGPTVLENKETGLVFTTIYFLGKEFSFEYHLKGNRLTNKFNVVFEVFKELDKLI